ncbi:MULTISPECIES: transferrin-binding protein-like solute binding protein [Neisseria]|uniref:transferrin-binding protein-like solute binding protein n=1 Tax=Neisseria TaxID=482 RepID=UPI0035A117B9
MKTLNFTTLAVLAVLGLSACGSSGNGNSTSALNTNNTSTNPSVSDNTNTNSTVSGNTDNTVTNGSGSTSNAQNTNTPANPVNNVNGFAYKFNSGSAASTINNANPINLSSSNRDILVVNGKSIEIVPSGIRSGAYSFLEDTDGSRFTVGDYFQNARFGVYQSHTDNNTHVYAQGSLTEAQNVPQSGQATYRGFGYHVDNNTLNQPYNSLNNPPRWVIHGVTVEVDFDKKSLLGQTITSDAEKKPLPVVDFEANITGNTFAGTHASGTRTQGAFYGPTGRDIAGVYVNEEKGFAGSYGVTDYSR